jgi:hypothetical protein
MIVVIVGLLSAYTLFYMGITKFFPEYGHTYTG